MSELGYVSPYQGIPPGPRDGREVVLRTRMAELRGFWWPPGKRWICRLPDRVKGFTDAELADMTTLDHYLS